MVVQIELDKLLSSGLEVVREHGRASRIEVLVTIDIEVGDPDGHLRCHWELEPSAYGPTYKPLAIATDRVNTSLEPSLGSTCG